MSTQYTLIRPAVEPGSSFVKWCFLYRKIDKKGWDGDTQAMRKHPFLTSLAVAAIVAMSSCAILRVGTYATDVFMEEPDPALAGAALPTMIKAAEIIRKTDPGNPSNAISVASLYVMYANAFLEGESFYLSDELYEEKAALTTRANALYLRALDLLLPLVESRSPGFLDAPFAPGVAGPADPAVAAALKPFGARDVPLMYWTAASILAAFGSNPLDFDNALRVGAAVALLERALELDPDWNAGSLYDLAFSAYASLPPDIGGNREKAEKAYADLVTLLGKPSAGALVAYASIICVFDGDYETWKAMLEEALAIEGGPSSRLMDALARRKAARLLMDASMYFYIADDESEN